MVINLDRKHPAKSNSYVRKKLGLPALEEDVIMDKKEKSEETSEPETEETPKEPEDDIELPDEKEEEKSDE